MIGEQKKVQASGLLIVVLLVDCCFVSGLLFVVIVVCRLSFG